MGLWVGATCGMHSVGFLLSHARGLEVSAEEDEAEKCQDGVPLCTNFSSRRVAFDFDANTIHEITPYSEIYGSQRESLPPLPQLP
eukprot:4603949-Amphidinium_carterae.2